jgi:hypothetical protein
LAQLAQERACDPDATVREEWDAALVPAA